MMNDAEAIRKIVEPVAPVEPNLLCEDLHTVFAQRRADSLVVLSNGIPIGFISYRKVADIFSNQFGYAVYQRLPISELMVPDFLTVDVNDSISEIVESALAREKSSVYEDIVAVQEGKYVGMISIARVLLEQRNRIREHAQELEESRSNLVKSNEQLHDALANLKHTESQFVQVEKLASIGTLAAGVAHDFNNMLAVILSSSQMLRMKHPQTSILLKYCDIIDNATQRASQLTKQLLQFSQKHFVTLNRTSLNDLITETVKILERSIDKNIQISLDLQSGLPSIEADDTQIQQVIMNLTLNARDAMRHGGVLSMATDVTDLDEHQRTVFDTDSPGPFIRLRIEDTGEGIPEENIKKIFDPFFTTKDFGKGTGLGLSVVYGIVKKHFGGINVKSTPGKGTIFTILFPPSKDPETIRPVLAAPTQRSGSGTILMVDDEELVLEVNASCLRELGYTVFTASSGIEGLQYISDYSDDIDIVLLDMMMPNMNGIETFHRMKSIRNDLKVFFVSGYTEEEKFRTVIENGALGLIRKPFELTLISQKIGEAIGHHQPV